MAPPALWSSRAPLPPWGGAPRPPWRTRPGNPPNRRRPRCAGGPSAACRVRKPNQCCERPSRLAIGLMPTLVNLKRATSASKTDSRQMLLLKGVWGLFSWGYPGGGRGGAWTQGLSPYENFPNKKLCLFFGTADTFVHCNLPKLFCGAKPSPNLCSGHAPVYQMSKRFFSRFRKLTLIRTWISSSLSALSCASSALSSSTSPSLYLYTGKQIHLSLKRNKEKIPLNFFSWEKKIDLVSVESLLQLPQLGVVPGDHLREGLVRTAARQKGG